MTITAYFAPETIDEARALFADHPGARPLSGGTDLLVQARFGRLRPAPVIDLKRLPGIQGISRGGDGSFVIGAATPCTALKEDAALAEAWPGVVEAANLIGSVQVRNRATLAGNLCNASPAADSVPAMVAAGAVCKVAGPAGMREVAVAEIPVKPGQTSLASGEFIISIRLPAPVERGGDAYMRAIPRTEMDIAVVGAGACLVFDADGKCGAARIALGAVGPKVMLADQAAAALVGSRLEADRLDVMAAQVGAVSSPIDDKRGSAEYRKAMASVLARRVVALAAARAGFPITGERA